MKALSQLCLCSYRRHYLGVLALLLVALFLSVTVYFSRVVQKIPEKTGDKKIPKNNGGEPDYIPWDGKVQDFQYPEDVIYVVPNIVHFVKFGNSPLSFIEAVCIRAAWLHQRPEATMIHCDQCNTIVRSPLWYLIKDIPVLKLQPTVRPTEVFGIKFSCVQHASDVVRLQVLMKYGGIYLDSDTYIVRSLDPYRRHEMSIGWPPNAYIGNQVLVAHKDARYLKLCYESYREYRPDLWYWNAGVLPTKKFLNVRPDLVNRVRYDFGVEEKVTRTLYARCDGSWRNFSAFHLFFRLIGTYVPPEPKRFGPITMDTVSKYDRNFGQMARLVLYGTTRMDVSEIKSIDWLSGHPPEYSQYGCNLPAPSAQQYVAMTTSQAPS
ncbi:unnamed protein product [Ixodes hexagonus]